MSLLANLFCESKCGLGRTLIETTIRRPPKMEPESFVPKAQRLKHPWDRLQEFVLIIQSE